MKDNRIILILTAILLFGAACRQTAKVNTAVAVSNTDSPVAANVSNAVVTKGSLPKSSADAADAAFDLQFLDTMSAHHQSAVEMAKLVVAKSDNAELKAFAAKIISEQNKEIAQMKSWREKWFAGKPTAMLMEMPGMAESMRGLSMKKMQAPAGNLFDLRFLGMMTAHHQGAVTMAKEALDKAEHSEIKTMANRIIQSQEAEIKQMDEWKAAWSK